MGTNNIKSLIKNLKQEVIDLRRDFHMHPELGFQEFKSAEKIETYLQNLGLETNRVAQTGVTAILDSGQPGPCLMLRADMDALPVTEENPISYKSRNEGIMHACGHDAHMAMLLVAAKVLIKGRGGHTGYPCQAIDPVITAASIIQSVQTIQTREMNAQHPVIIMFGKINAGKKANIIPEEVCLEGTIRFLHAALPDSENNPTKKFIRI